MARRRNIDVERDKTLEAIYREMGARVRGMTEHQVLGEGESDARIVEALGHAAWALEQAAHLAQLPATGDAPPLSDTATQWGRLYHRREL